MPTLCNFATFVRDRAGRGRTLVTNAQDVGEAESLYRRALDVDPKHVDTLYNFATLARDHKRDMGEAESLYRRALDVDPKHADTSYSLNLLLEEKEPLGELCLEGDSDADDFGGAPSDGRHRRLGLSRAGIFAFL